MWSSSCFLLSWTIKNAKNHNDMMSTVEYLLIILIEMLKLTSISRGYIKVVAGVVSQQ